MMFRAAAIAVCVGLVSVAAMADPPSVKGANVDRVFGDRDHKPHAPALVSEKVTITVK